MVFFEVPLLVPADKGLIDIVFLFPRNKYTSKDMCGLILNSFFKTQMVFLITGKEHLQK